MVGSRALHVGFVGIAAALVALILSGAPVGAKGATRGEGRIAFTFGESGDLHPGQLSVMDADGTNRRVLPLDHLGGLAISPDGRFVAYQGLHLTTVNLDGRPRYRRVVRNVSNGGDPDWSPNGRSIAFERGGDIWVVDLNDRRQRRIVRHGYSPTWSPDSRRLAFVRDRRVRCPNQGLCRDIWVLDLATKEERRLVSGGRTAVWTSHVSWAPNGRQLVFERCRQRGYLVECFIHVIRADGTAQRRLFEGSGPVWSPNGQEIAFIGDDARRHYSDAIIRARLDGSGRRVLFGKRPFCGCGSLAWVRAPRASR